MEEERLIGLGTWAVLERAIVERRRVRLRYHGSERVVCPHVLGWKNGRGKVLLLQVGGMTSAGLLPGDLCQCWRSLFVDHIEEAVIIAGGWETAENYSLDSNCVDVIDVAAATGPVI